MCLAQGQNAVTPVRLQPAASRSCVKYSTIEPLRSFFNLYCWQRHLHKVVFVCLFNLMLYIQVNIFQACREVSWVEPVRCCKEEDKGSCSRIQLAIFTVTETQTRYYSIAWERSGSVVECLTPDRGAVGLSHIGVTALCPLARTLILA